MKLTTQTVFGWIIAFIVGYISSSKAGQFIVENLNKQLTTWIFGVNFIVFAAQFVVIFICYWGMKINSRVCGNRDNIYEQAKAAQEKDIYRIYSRHILTLYIVGTLLSGGVIVANYGVFGRAITVAFIILFLMGFCVIYMEKGLKNSEMSIKNICKKIFAAVKLDDKNSQMFVILFLLWIIVIMVVMLLRLPSFTMGQKILEL